MADDIRICGRRGLCCEQLVGVGSSISSEAAMERGTKSPYLSVVVCSRNDDHGGNFLARFEVFAHHLTAQCERHGLQAELVVVEWNPQKDREPLGEAIQWPSPTPSCPIRIIQVPEEQHRRFDNSDKLPLHQFIAKNVGIRRAQGDFVVASNIDIIFSDELIAGMAKGNLEPESFYRAGRHDVSPMVPVEAGASEQLGFCARNVIRIHEKFGSRDLRNGNFFRIYRSTFVLLLAIWSFPFGFVPFLVWGFFKSGWRDYGNKVAHAKRSLALRRHFGYLYTNACGDFTLMARDKWNQLQGYWEYPGFPMHVDGLLLYAAKNIGMEEETWEFPACVFHMEPDDGSGFDEYASGEKWEHLEGKGIPYISTEQLIQWALDMATDNETPVQNDKNWGASDIVLPEHGPSQ